MRQSKPLIACRTEDETRRDLAVALIPAFGEVLYGKVQNATNRIVGAVAFCTDHSSNFFATLMPPYNKMARTVARLNRVQ